METWIAQAGWNLSRNQWNAYVFLSLYRLTGNLSYLYRAKALASFLLDSVQKLIAAGQMHGGDNPYSLFEGIGGMAYLFLDMKKPTSARFPAYELKLLGKNEDRSFFMFHL